jgi:hypothetical protein
MGILTLLKIVRAKMYKISMPYLCSKAIQHWTVGHCFSCFEFLRARLPLLLMELREYR